MRPVLAAPDLVLVPEPLTQAAFSQFGIVIERPTANNHTGEILFANQGSAIKSIDVSKLVNLYPHASKKPSAKPSINLFTCYPRNALNLENKIPETVFERLANPPNAAQALPSTEFRFDIDILEKHPFTAQTFVPMGLERTQPDTSYLVIVATSKGYSSQAEQCQLGVNKPHPDARSDSLASRLASTDSEVFDGYLPDLTNVHAFIARGDQAVTYGAGTWHAPMVVFGARAVDFVVIQYVNGVPEDDCNEVDIVTRANQRDGLRVVLTLDRKALYASKL